MQILITGITGLIGKHLMQVLLENNYTSIKGTYHSSKNIEAFLQQKMEMIQADITQPKDVEDICKNCTTVVHTAARVIDFGTKEQFYEAHYDATHSLLKDAKKHGVQHFIYISSVGVASGIDRNKTIPNEATPLIKTGVHYDDAKIDTEDLVKNFCLKNNIFYTIIRPSAVIGPGSVWVVEPLKRMDTAFGLKLIDNGKQPACLLDAGNLANGIFLCMTKEIAHNQTYFFMDDWDISWKQYFTDLAAIKNKTVDASIPFKVAYFTAVVAEFVFPLFGKKPPIAKKSVQATGINRTVSTQKARTELGWKSQINYATSMQRIKESIV